MTEHDELLYKKYKYYGFNENVTTLGIMKPIYDKETYTIKVNMHSFKYCKFEGFYLIRFHSYYLNKLKETMIYYGKDYASLQNKLYILYNNLYFGHSRKHLYNKKAIIDEYCSVYDEFQKIKFIQRIPPELLVDKNILFKDIKLSETEYKSLEKFLLKQLKFENIIKIEHFPKRGFLRRI